MHSDDFVKAVTVIAQLRYAIFRFAATGFALIDRTRLLINEDEECTLHNLQSGFDASHFTSVLDEMEEALRALHRVEATREFASVQTKTFRAMRNSLVEFLSPVEWEGSAWQQVCLEVEAAEDLHDAMGSNSSMNRAYRQTIEKLVSRTLAGFPASLVAEQTIELLPERLRPFFRLAQKLSELYRESHWIPARECNTTGRAYLFMSESMPRLTKCFEACLRLQPELSDLLPAKIDYGMDPIWWLLDRQSSVLARLRELAVDASSKAITEFTYSRIDGGFCICGINVELKSELEVKTMQRLCGATARLSAEQLAEGGQDGVASEETGIRALLCRIRDQLKVRFGITEDPIPSASRNKAGGWKLDRELLIRRANELQQHECQRLQSE